jgi:hypothetical protein
VRGSWMKRENGVGKPWRPPLASLAVESAVVASNRLLRQRLQALGLIGRRSIGPGQPASRHAGSEKGAERAPGRCFTIELQSGAIWRQMAPSKLLRGLPA